MKFKTTKKDMKSYDHIIGTGYCNLQNLLKFQSPIAYSTRPEGWASDYYDIDGILISTGYDPLNSKKTYATHEMVKSYDEKARVVAYDNNVKYEDQEKVVNELLKDFIKLATTKPRKGDK